MLGSGPFPETIIAPIDGAEMVLVPAGDFVKGISEDELAQIYLLDNNENPVFASEVPSRIIYLKDFYIDRYPVTNYQYQTVGTTDEAGRICGLGGCPRICRLGG